MGGLSDPALGWLCSAGGVGSQLGAGVCRVLGKFCSSSDFILALEGGEGKTLDLR